MRPHLILIAAGVAALAFIAPAHAVDKTNASPESKCIAEASAFEGEKRDKAISACPKPHSQQDKMKYCNATAREKDLHGDERRGYMSTCLKG